MTSSTTISSDEAVSYSARACPRCATAMTRSRSRFGRTVWACPTCGKRAK